MWFYVEIELTNQEIDIVNEKLLILNEDCYLLILGEIFFRKSQIEQTVFIEKIVDKYLDFTIFWAMKVESMINIANLILPKFNIKLASYPYETNKFKSNSAVVLTDFLSRVDNSFLKIEEKSIKPLVPLNNIQMEVENKEQRKKLEMAENNNIELFRRRILEFTRASSIIYIVEATAKGEIAGEIFPGSKDIEAYCKKYNEEKKREINMSIDVVTQSQLSRIFFDDSFRQEIVEYLDFLRYDFLPLYSDNESTSLNLLKIYTRKYLFEFIKIKPDKYYFIVTLKENEFHINLINKDEALANLNECTNRLYQLKIVNNFIRSYDGIPANFMGRVKENIGIVFPTVINRAQRIIRREKQINKIEVIFDSCTFIINHTPNWNDSINCFV